MKVSVAERAKLLRRTSRKHKYNAKGRFVNDNWCASEAEAQRYEQLLVLLRHGKIENLTHQKKYPLIVNGVKIAEYWADFTYDVIDQERKAIAYNIVEDVKGMIMDVYLLKKKLMLAVHGIEVVEIAGKSVGDWAYCIAGPDGQCTPAM